MSKLDGLALILWICLIFVQLQVNGCRDESLIARVAAIEQRLEKEAEE